MKGSSPKQQLGGDREGDRVWCCGRGDTDKAS